MNSNQRESDGPDSEEYKRRRLLLHDTPPVAAVNGAMARARVLASIIKDVGIGSFLIVVMSLTSIGWLSGWLPFPLASAIKDYTDQHRVIAERVATMERSLMIFEQQAEAARQQDRELWRAVCAALVATKPSVRANCNGPGA